MKGIRPWLSGLAISLLFIMAFAGTHQALASEPDINLNLVNAQWLKANAGRKDVVIVYLSYQPADFKKEHIPGSRYMDWRKDLADPNQERYYELPPKEHFEAAMGKIGARPGSLLVFYDNLHNRLAIRALWVAAYYGHTNAVVLEGGIAAWKAAGFSLSRQARKVNPTTYQAGMGASAMRVDKDYVAKHLRNKEVVFVDSRPWKMYTGQAPGKLIHTGAEVARRGHLPQALSLPWKSNITEIAIFKDRDSLKKVYGGRGLTGERTVVFYCNEGVHAVYNWFVASRMLGMKDVKVYEGSMGEWADDPMRPMVTGLGF